MKNNIFQKARIKLTLYYIGIMAVILLIFSSGLIYTIEHKIRRGFREKIILKDEFVILESDTNLIETTSDEIEYIIFSIDGLLLIIIGFSSYLLAGKTLLPIKNALDTQKRFSADASHDLRTPLAIMTTMSEVTLQNKNTSPQELRYTLKSNLEEVKKMSRLVTDLLLISRGDNQSLVMSSTHTDIHLLIEKLVRQLQIQVKRKNLDLKIIPYKKIVTSIDACNFERAILNILQNAINYTKTGSISIDLQEDSQKVYVLISDTGVGIDQKDLPFVFDRFYKASHSRNDVSSSGLGLPITKLIVEQHGGSVKIESKIHQGTIVTITIPKK